MHCETAIERIGDHLDGRLDAAQRDELLAHVANCASCRAAVTELEPLWHQLEAERARAATAMTAATAAGEPSVATPEQRRRRRFDLLLDAWRLGASERDETALATPHVRTSVTPLAKTSAPPLAKTSKRAEASRSLPILQLAAALVLGLLAGNLLPWRIAGAPDRGTTPPPSAELPREFLLALRERPSQASPDPAEMRRLVAEYATWAGELARDERLVGAEKLRDDARTVLRPGAGGIDVDSTLPEPNEPWLSGFFLIRARDLAEAIELARASPHLRHGGEIELREIDRER